MLISPIRDPRSTLPFLVAHSLDVVEKGKIRVKVMNPNRRQKLIIPALTALAEVEVPVYEEEAEMREESTQAQLDDVMSKITLGDDGKASPEQRTRFREFITPYLQLFRDERGCSHVLRHSIETGSHPPTISLPLIYLLVNNDLLGNACAASSQLHTIVGQISKPVGGTSGAGQEERLGQGGQPQVPLLR